MIDPRNKNGASRSRGTAPSAVQDNFTSFRINRRICLIDDHGIHKVDQELGTGLVSTIISPK